MVNNQKMSKSPGNFYTIKDALKEYIPNVVRYIILSHNYSSKIGFSKDSFIAAEMRVFYFYKTLLSIFKFLSQNDELEKAERTEAEELPLLSAFIESMDNNFSTAKVIESDC